MRILTLSIVALLIGFSPMNNIAQDVTGINIGNVAPELDFKSPNGDNIKLSSV